MKPVPVSKIDPVTFVETWYNDPVTNTVTRIRTSPTADHTPVVSPPPPSSPPSVVTMVPELTWNEVNVKDDGGGLEIEVSTIRKHAAAIENENTRTCCCIML